MNVTDVLITGIGVISPIGAGRKTFWQRLCAGESGIVPGKAPDGVRAAARLTEAPARELIRSAHYRRMDPVSRMIAGAARLALEDAGVDTSRSSPDRTGIVVGSAFGDMNETVDYLQRLFTKGPSLVSPMVFQNLVVNAPASYTAMELGFTGPNFTVTQGEISGDQAIALGCELIRSGRSDLVLAGGGDELSDIVWRTHDRLGALAGAGGGVERCSPYDRRRSGVVLGEGAAMLVLESAHAAAHRGARAYAAIERDRSFGVPSSMYDWPSDRSQIAAELHDLCCDTRSGQPLVDAVFGSANSSRRLDQLEVDVLAHLFGEAAGHVAVTSIKGAIGEFGAAGALTAAAAALALHHGVVPPTCQLNEPISCGLQFTADLMRRPLNRILQLSIARGGAVAATIFEGVPS